MSRRRPGEIRDAIRDHLCNVGEASVTEITAAVRERYGVVSPSSVRSSLLLLTGTDFDKVGRGRYRLKHR